MNKGKKVVNFLRTVFSILATITGIVTFFLMATLDDSISGWFKFELILLALFGLSVLVGAIADDPNRLLRHLFAIMFCTLAFAYRRLHIDSEPTQYCNYIRRKCDGYPKAYLFALDRYDTKIYKDFDEYDYEEC